eukprot:6198151-Pleurochrysis_carterae.AAC.4
MQAEELFLLRRRPSSGNDETVHELDGVNSLQVAATFQFLRARLHSRLDHTSRNSIIESELVDASAG